MTYIYKVTKSGVTNYYSSSSKARYIFIDDTATQGASIEWVDDFAIVWNLEKTEQIGTIQKITLI